MCSAAIAGSAASRPQGCKGGSVATSASALRAISSTAAPLAPLAPCGGGLCTGMFALRQRSLDVTAAAAVGPSGGGGSGGLGGSPPPSTSFARRRQLVQSPQRAAALYSAALDLARSEQFDRARRVFQAAVTADPCLLKAWVSWAQVRAWPAHGRGGGVGCGLGGCQAEGGHFRG